MTECEIFYFIHCGPNFFKNFVTFFLRLLRIVAPKCQYCTPTWDFERNPFTLKSEIVHMVVVVTKWSPNFAILLQKFCLAICWV